MSSRRSAPDLASGGLSAFEVLDRILQVRSVSHTLHAPRALCNVKILVAGNSPGVLTRSFGSVMIAFGYVGTPSTMPYRIIAVPARIEYCASLYRIRRLPHR